MRERATERERISRVAVVWGPTFLTTFLGCLVFLFIVKVTNFLLHPAIGENRPLTSVIYQDLTRHLPKFVLL